MPRWSRWMLAVVLLLLAGAAGGYVWLRAAARPLSGSRDVPGLSAEASVFRDRWSIPHIFAASEEDAAVALGFAHAEDRLWQMEAMRRLGAGRLAEVLGPKALPSDRLMRTLGLYRLADEQYPRLDEGTRRVLDAYARGVNARLGERWRPLPPEFLLLRFSPEPWRPADSLVWLKLMAHRISGNRRDELLRLRLSERLSPEQLHDLWPDPPPDAPATLAGAYDGNAQEEALARLPALALPPSEVLPLPLSEIAAGLDAAGLGPDGGSNAWVLSGSLTATGKPLLANDPHLSFGLPQPWYLVRIALPDGERAGATSPGFPALILGRNSAVAWGITASDVDVEDVFIERSDPADPDRYDSPAGPLPFTWREEVIDVRDAPAERLRIRATRHGPVISDLPGVPAPHVLKDSGEDMKQYALALAAPWLEADDRTPDALLALNRARDGAEVVAAALGATGPQQNLLYADTGGRIGFVSTGRIPWRQAGCGWQPSPGWTGACDWRGFLPPEAQPQALDPPAGRLVNANNRPVGAGYPWPIQGTWDDGFRALRIGQLLDEGLSRAPEGASAMQMDRLSLMARRLLPLMLDLLPAERRADAPATMLASWDGAMDGRRPEPLIFAAWMRALNFALFADALGPAFADYWDYRAPVIEQALAGQAGWCAGDAGSSGRERCAAFADRALDEALDDLGRRYGSDPARWRWADAHPARFVNPFWQQVPLIGGFASTSVPMNGGSDTVDRAAMRFADPERPFAAVHGAGYRAVYDLADLSRSRYVLATGQSANPLSPHYLDMTALWREGGGLRLDAPRAVLERDAASHLRLLPTRDGERRQAPAP